MKGKFKELRDCEEDDLFLLKSVARNEPLTRPGNKNTYTLKQFSPIYKHPLPVSDHRYKRESILRKVQSCSLDKQAIAAVTKGDPWVLEEIYMRGAPVDKKDGNGFSPLHIACQLNNFDCVLVLLNIGVDFNAISLAGYTPLFMAKAANATQSVLILEEVGAKQEAPLLVMPPSAMLLDQDYPRRETSVLEVKREQLGVPHEHDMY